MGSSGGCNLNPREWPTCIAPLSATSQLVWFPYSAIDHLQQALGENESNRHNQAILGKLQRKLDEYFEKLKKATDDYKKLVQKPLRA